MSNTISGRNASARPSGEKPARDNRLFRFSLIGAIICLAVFATAFQSGSPVPPQGGGAANPPAGSLGQSVYRDKCSTCHGIEGKGDGPIAMYLDPRPRDFTRGTFKFRTTASGSIPTDDDLRRTITEGLHNTAMPDWKPYLHGDTLEAVIAQIKSFSPRFASEKPKPVDVSPEPPSSPASIEAGKAVFAKLQCGACHGSHGDLTDAISTDMTDDWNQPIAPANMTEPWTFKGGATAHDIYMRFTTGIDGAPMPSYVGTATDKEMWDLAHYVVSLGRKPAWAMSGDELKALYRTQEQAAKANAVNRGKYLVETHGCVSCHSPVRNDGTLIPELRLAGGVKMDLYPFGTYVTYNLTSDKETGLGNWTDAEIKQVLTRGITKAGWRMLPFPMPWTAYAHMTDDDLNAIIAYLRTVPAVSNKIPEPQHPNVFSYLWGKFQILILHHPLTGQSFHGNAGSAPYKDVASAASGTEVRP